MACADFVGGASDMTAYDPDCLYTDPFAGFRGTERFKQNLSNFGAVTFVFHFGFAEKLRPFAGQKKPVMMQRGCEARLGDNEGDGHRDRNKVAIFRHFEAALAAAPRSLRPHDARA